MDQVMGHAAERPAVPCALAALGIRGPALTLVRKTEKEKHQVLSVLVC